MPGRDPRQRVTAKKTNFEPSRAPKTRNAPRDVERLTRSVVDAGVKAHRALGPGLESAFEHCLAPERHARGVSIARQVALPIVYDGARLDAGYRLDLVVEDLIIIEIKAVDALTRLHEAQILTYLKPSGRRPGFLMNFDAPLFKQGVKRLVLKSSSGKRRYGARAVEQGVKNVRLPFFARQAI
jgi:GxxExxY protein